MVQTIAFEDCRFYNDFTTCLLCSQYEQERRKYAQDLIEFDKEYAALFSRKPRTAENVYGVSHEQFLR